MYNFNIQTYARLLGASLPPQHLHRIYSAQQADYLHSLGISEARY